MVLRDALPRIRSRNKLAPSYENSTLFRSWLVVDALFAQERDIRNAKTSTVPKNWVCLEPNMFTTARNFSRLTGYKIVLAPVVTCV